MERITRNPPLLLLAGALIGAFTLTLLLTAETTFYGDTWDFLVNRRDPTVDALLQPHNEHLVVIPVLVQELILRLFGMTSATPEIVLQAIFLVVIAAELYVYVSRRVGPWLALFAAVLVLFLGPAWEVLLWGFELTFSGPILFGLAMLLALEREDRRGDVAACLFLTTALGFSSLGLPFIAAAAVAVLQGSRESWRARAYIFVIPAVLFVIWYLGWGHEAESHLSLHNVLASPPFVIDSVAIALGAMTGLGNAGLTVDPIWGRVFLVALVVGLLYYQVRRPRVLPGLWPIAAAAFVNWFLTAFNAFPGRDPTSSRYQYSGAIFILMIVANLIPEVRLGRRAIWIGLALVALAVAPNLTILRDGSDVQKQQAVLTRSDTAALEIARRTVDPDFELTAEVAGTPSLVNVFARPYLQAVDEYGSPAYSTTELAAAPEEGRRWADIVLSQALPLSTVTSFGAYESGSSGENCVTVPGGGDAMSEVPVSAGLTRIEVPPGRPAAFSLRRFAIGEYPVITEGAPGDSLTLLRIPRDTTPRPWYLHVNARQSIRVCR